MRFFFPSGWSLSGLPFAITAVMFVIAWGGVNAYAGQLLWSNPRSSFLTKLAALLWFLTLSGAWGAMLGEMVLLMFTPATAWSLPLLATWVLVLGVAILISLLPPVALANTYRKLRLFDA